MIVFKLDNYFYCGVVMQHLGNTTYANAYSRFPNNSEGHLFTTLVDRGIVHHDLHHQNIMVYKGKLWPIDFGGVEIRKTA